MTVRVWYYFYGLSNFKNFIENDFYEIKFRYESCRTFELHGDISYSIKFKNWYLRSNSLVSSYDISTLKITERSSINLMSELDGKMIKIKYIKMFNHLLIFEIDPIQHNRNRKIKDILEYIDD